MAKTDSEFQGWLLNDRADPVILLEATHKTGTSYAASKPFVTTSTDVPSNTLYEGFIKGDIEIEERFDVSEISDIDLHNDGELDSWLDNKYRGRTLKLLLGDSTWCRDDFRTVVDGVSGGVFVSDDETLTFEFLDRSETLRATVATETAPVLLGKVFNVTPVFVSGTTYKVHDAALTSLDAVRDNGAALTGGGVGYTDNADGTFTLTAAPVGAITCDATKGTNFDTEEIITELCSRISVSVDSTNLAAFGNTDEIGIYLTEPTEVSDILEEILSSVGGVYRFNATDAELEIFRFEAPAVSEDIELIADDILERGVRLEAVEEAVNLFTLGYYRNWSVQDPGSLAASVSAADKDSYSTEYRTKEKNNAISADYPVSINRRVNTLLFDATEAQTEANRRGALRNQERKVWNVTAFMPQENYQLGQTVKITYPDKGFESGQNALIIAISRSLTDRMMSLSVWL